MDKNKIQGCLIGVAVGDALGAPFEGSSAESRMIKKIGGWIDDFYGRKGEWTDDTGMTLATVRAFIDREKTDALRSKATLEWFRETAMVFGK